MIVQSTALLWRRPMHDKPIQGVVRSHGLSFRLPRRVGRLSGLVQSKAINHYGRIHGAGFIAGGGDGIVTVGGVPASRQILLFERERFVLVRSTWSNGDGTYLFDRLNPDFEYMVLAVDHKKQYEPVAYDFVVPALPDNNG